jgi:hypothetical protein
MLKRNHLFQFAALMLGAILLAGLPASVYAAQTDTWQPSQPPADMGSIVWTNFNGHGGQLTIDLQGGAFAIDDSGDETSEWVISSVDFYTVPEATNEAPGRLQVDLAPGTYNYTANVANIGSTTGTIEVVAGQVTGLSFYGGEPRVVVHNHSPQEGDDDQSSFTTTVFTQLLVAEEDLTPQAQ